MNNFYFWYKPYGSKAESKHLNNCVIEYSSNIKIIFIIEIRPNQCFLKITYLLKVKVWFWKIIAKSSLVFRIINGLNFNNFNKSDN